MDNLVGCIKNDVEDWVIGNDKNNFIGNKYVLINNNTGLETGFVDKATNIFI